MSEANGTWPSELLIRGNTIHMHRYEPKCTVRYIEKG